MTLLKSLFENINVVVPDAKILFWISVSNDEGAAVNTKSTKMLLINISN